MFVVQATGVNAIFFPSLLPLWENKLECFSSENFYNLLYGFWYVTKAITSVEEILMGRLGNPYWRGWLSTVDLLVPILRAAAFITENNVSYFTKQAILKGGQLY
jgi:hypothetical protein